MFPLAYYHHHSVASWAAHAVAGSLIHRAVWSVTRGLPTVMVVMLAVAAVAGLALWRRR